MPNIPDEITELQAAIATLTTEVNSLSAQVIAQTSAINTLNTEVGSLSAQVSAQGSDIAALQIEIGQTPRIIANGAFDQSVETINNSGGTGVVDLLTSATTEVYRVSVSEVVTRGFLGTSLSWTDESGHNNSAFPSLSNGGSAGFAPQNIRVLAGTTIQILTSSGASPISAPPSPGAFKIYWTIEQLS